MCKGAKVMGHITGKSQPKGDDDEEWEAIDSRIRSWFYSTCEPNVLNIITTDNCTAKDLWEALDSYFLNNKLSHSLQLQTAFRNTKRYTRWASSFQCSTAPVTTERYASTAAQAPQVSPSAPQFTDLASLFSSMFVQQPTPTQDNNYYMDTDASLTCLTTKDLNTSHLLHRSDSVGDLYPVLQSPQPSVSSATAFFAVSPLVRHRRLGHPGASTFSFLKSRNFISCSNTLLPTCHACQLDKHCRLSFSHSTTKTSKVFELVHSDLWTSPISSLSGYKYYILFLDDFSHFLWVFPLRVNSDVFHVFSTFHDYVVNQFKTDIQSFQCDNGREFNNANLLTLFQKHGIKIRFSCPYMSQQNGKAERAIRTINNVMRTLLFQASLPPTFWAEALNMTVHILNLLPTTTLSFQSPCEIL
ncbi:hypothetical protein OSB04_032273 [Centaurea solstitialis]|uniref:Integrase catalytic domain-containing protein n=1 Tax=Centaurea solstitialis TaxID=347529 RepID=A0AA38W5J9_9ASTR|nr:hypothetical protein OSB04_032273 [Centaurea solstitialis]